MTAEMGQTMLVRMCGLEQSQVQMNLNVMTSIAELRRENAAQLRIVNNNIRAYGGTIQGSLVRGRPSNRVVSLASQNEDQENLAPFEEVSPATLSHNPRSLLALWHEFKFEINGRNLPRSSPQPRGIQHTTNKNTIAEILFGRQ